MSKQVKNKLFLFTVAHSDLNISYKDFNAVSTLLFLEYDWVCGVWESAGLEWSYEFEGERKESFGIGDEYVDESWSEKMLVEEKGYRWWGKSVIFFNSAQFWICWL
jgi:hypothetical protein